MKRNTIYALSVLSLCLLSCSFKQSEAIYLPSLIRIECNNSNFTFNPAGINFEIKEKNYFVQFSVSDDYSNDFVSSSDYMDCKFTVNGSSSCSLIIRDSYGNLVADCQETGATRSVVASINPYEKYTIECEYQGVIPQVFEATLSVDYC